MHPIQALRPALPLRAGLKLLVLYCLGLANTAQADDYEIKSGTPLTAQTTVNGFFGYGANPLSSTLLLPVGTVLDPLVTSYVCVQASSKEITDALSADGSKLVEVRDDAAMHVATAGDFRSARLESALQRLRGLWYFAEQDSLTLAQMILLVSLSAQ